MDGSGWKTTNKEVGPRSSGIRSNLGEVEFSAEQLRNKYSFVGLDQIGIVDPLKGKGACEK
uniref:Uncharacterized protein n=1 Tax=Heterorhabditis bacteriophora TaxID=37862 RepID=A0A1I7XV52_HETBA